MDRASSPSVKGPTSAQTRRAVLDLIRGSKGLSRADLARQSGLTEATISRIVRDLQTEGIVRPIGRATSTGGKPPTLIALNQTSTYALGVGLDGFAAIVVLCTLDGAVVARRQAPLPAESATPAGILDHVATVIAGLLIEYDVDPSAVRGVGLASAGRVHGSRGWSAGSVISDPWEEFDVGPYLAGRTGLPVTVENDANCAALGSFWTSGQPSRSLLTVYMAYGIGAGIILNGRLYRGTSANAGEIGHRSVHPEGGPCWCGSRGCLEAVASPRGMVRRIAADRELRSALRIADTAGPGETHRALLRALDHGEAPALTLIQDAARHLADTVVDLTNTFDLDWVQLAGHGFAMAPHLFLAETQTAVARTSLARGVHPVRIELGPTGPEVAAAGAAAVVLDGRILTNS